MDRKRLLELLQEKKVQDYTFTIFFFLVFSVFVVFAIRPNLITAFSLQKELQELKLKNREKEEMILQIVDYQTLLEENRDTIPLLDEAVPSAPALAKAVEDVRKTASESGLLVTMLSAESIEFTDEDGTGELQTFSLVLEADTSLSQVNTFLNSVLAQRRLKMFEMLDLTTVGGETNLSLTIKTYYL